jgi:diacylglycerol kinase family enzyme
LIVRNPKAGVRSRFRLVEELVARLSEHDIEAAVLTDLDELASKTADLLARDELRAVVAAGGDGTAAEIVNRTPPATPLALLPLVTENLLAKYLKSPADPVELAQTIANGLTIYLDAGRAGERLFLLMISAGFDAEVVHRLHTARQGNISHWTYINPILAAIRSYRYPELRVYCYRSDTGEPLSQTRPQTVRWFFAFNLPAYAFGLKFTPGASGTDQQFDVCTFQKGSFLSGMKYLGHVLAGRHARLADCEITQCSKLHIESDEPVAYQLDGDPAGQLPVDVEILAGRLRVVVTRQSARRLGFDISCV